MSHTRSLAALLVLTASVSAQGLKLNGPLARPVGGDIFEFELSPDGGQVVYAADQDTNEVIELYTARADGSGVPLKLSGPMVAGGSLVPSSGAAWRSFLVAAVGRRVVYVADQEVDGVMELFSVPLNGGAAVKLNLPGTRVDPRNYSISADGARVVYMANGLEYPYHLRVFSAPIGGGTPVQLNAALPVWGDVSRFRVSPDSRRVVYRADQERYGVEELYATSVDGGQVVKLSPEHQTSQDVGVFEIDPSGRQVVYAYGTELHVAPLDAPGSARALNPPGITAGGPFQISSDGKHVVFPAVAGAATGPGLCAVPLVEGGTVLQLFPPSGRSIRPLTITPDARTILFADTGAPLQYELHAVSIDGSTGPVQLSEHDGYFTEDGIEVAPDSRRVVWLDHDVLAGGLFSAPLDGSALPARIGPPRTGGFSITPDGGRTVFVAQESNGSALELFSVPIAGGEDPQRLNAPLPDGGDVGGLVPGLPFRISPDGRRVIYSADQVVDEEFELFGVPTDGSAAPWPISGKMPIGPVEGDVLEFELSPDGEHAVYVADQDLNDRFELFSVPTSGRGKVVRLNEPLGPGEWLQFSLIMPDGEDVVYFREERLWKVPIGGGPSVVVSGPVVVTGQYYGDSVFVTPDRSRFVFWGREGTTRAFFSVPLDGSALPVQISPWQSQEGLLQRVDFTPDGQRLIYLTDPGPNGFLYELFSTRVDGSAPPVLLSTPHVAGGRVKSSAVLSPDGERVVYIADHEILHHWQLYSVPVDGSASPTRLSAPSISTSIVRRAQVAGPYAFYLADQDTAGVDELYRVAIDGSAPPTKLNGALDTYADVVAFRVSEDGGRVVYQADHDADEAFGLYSVPGDASAPPIAVNGFVRPARAFSGDPDDVITLTSDGSRVVFHTAFGGPGPSRLYGAPVDGSAGPVLLHPWAFEVQLTADERALLHLGNVDGSGIALFRTPVDRAGGSRRISGFGTNFYDALEVFRFEETPDGRVVYLLDQEADEVLELFLAFLVHPRGFAPSPPRPAGVSR